jgi:hypothetical protein
MLSSPAYTANIFAAVLELALTNTGSKFALEIPGWSADGHWGVNLAATKPLVLMFGASGDALRSPDRQGLSVTASGAA